ncbi:MAG: NAD-dependent epimerase/dehydratase family protein [Thermaurantiacus sp.]|nr:NAD-dependent epimerase/dehydratase family protein [Thermaurantiacus sp.]
MKVFLTGGSGMVGRNLRETAPPDAEIVAPTRHEVDLTDPPAVQRALDAAAPDLVIHAAGRVGGIAANMADQAGFLVENLRMGLAVLEAAHRAGVRCLNLASSCIYPPEAPIPFTEDRLLTGTLEPTNEGYALAKLSVVRLGRYLNQASGAARIKSLVPCNLFGRHDNFDPTTAHLVPAALRKVHEAHARGGDVVVWGDGSARREFLYAGDAARMIWHAVARFDDLPEVMNLGAGTDHTILEYYQSAARVVGWRGRFQFDHSRPVGMRRKLVSVEWQRRLGFPEPRPLDEGLALTYRFFLERHAA